MNYKTILKTFVILAIVSGVANATSVCCKDFTTNTGTIIRDTNNLSDWTITPTGTSKVKVQVYLCDIKPSMLIPATQKSGLIFDIQRMQAYNLSQKYLGVNPHAIRHSRAIDLITHGTNVEIVRRLLGAYSTTSSG